MYNRVFTSMAESRITDIPEYTGIHPTVFKKINAADVKVNPFQTYKLWTVISGSDTGSVLPLIGTYSDTRILPALGTSLTYNDDANIDGSLQTITYFSINHQFYKYKKFPALTFGPTDLNRTKKFLFQTASILSFPQIRVGEGIKPGSFEITSSYLQNTIYGSGIYGSSVYGSIVASNLFLKSDRYGNLIDTTFNTASIVPRCVWYEGFNEYFDDSRIELAFNNVSFEPGVTTVTGNQSNIGLSAKFNGNGFIKSDLPGKYDRNHDHAISFFISASNTGDNKVVITKSNNNSQPQYPFKIEISGSNEIIFSVAGSTSYKSQITSSIDMTSWRHVVCQKTGSVMEMYIDGVLHSATSTTLYTDPISPFTASARIDNTASLYIGGYESSQQFTGNLDEIRIFNNALTVSQIANLGDRTEGGSLLQTNIVGNVFSKQGIVVISSADYRFNNVVSLPYSASYRSTKTIYELDVIAEVGSGDFNATNNITTTTDDDSTYKSFVKDKIFAPYITTIGLYDDAGQLLAIGKLAQPIRKRNDVDMNFMIRIDLDRNIS